MSLQTKGSTMRAKRIKNALICCYFFLPHPSVVPHFGCCDSIVCIYIFFCYQKGNNLPNKCFIVTYLPKYWRENQKKHEQRKQWDESSVRVELLIFSISRYMCVFFSRFFSVAKDVERARELRWCQWITWHSNLSRWMNIVSVECCHIECLLLFCPMKRVPLHLW